MKNLFYPLLMATAFVATACTNNLEDDVTPVDPNGKTPISFIAENNNQPVTRVGFEGNSESYTEVAMHIRSNEKGGTGIRETHTLAKATHDTEKTSTSVSGISSLSDSHTRYWDDAFGRDAQLSVFAIAVPGKPSPSNSGKSLEALLAKPENDKVWEGAALSELVSWTVSKDQSESGKLAAEDLVYSNNIKSTESVDNRLKFILDDNNNTDGPGKFEKGTLEFHHALSRITVNLTKGTGFTTSSFAFTSTSGNVSLINVPVSGELNLVDGAWDKVTPGTISGMELQSSTADKYSLMAQMLPGYVINSTGTDVNMLSFEIDKNTYYVTQAQMYAALDNAPASDKEKIKFENNSVTMQKGYNYVFNITVNKTSVVVTATLAAFEKVTAGDINKDNSHGELTFTTTGADDDDFKLYRLEDSENASKTNWFGTYTAADPNDLNKENNVWKTGWYFENDAAYYHFRAVSSNVSVKNSTGTDGDYFIMSSGTTDYHWGAPMVADISYDKDNGKGYASAISNAIRATSSTIKLTKLHMMSSIHIVLRTTTGNDAVVLEDKANDKKCEVKLTKFYEESKVNMGNGLVTITSDALTANMPFVAPDFGTENESNNTHVKLKKTFTLYVVPQYVKRTDDAIGLTITTPDGNVYTISDLSVSTSTLFWEPNHEYTYTFTLTKAGVVVTCTVEAWVPVSAGSSDISLED